MSAPNGIPEYWLERIEQVYRDHKTDHERLGAMQAIASSIVHCSLVPLLDGVQAALEIAARHQSTAATLFDMEVAS